MFKATQLKMQSKCDEMKEEIFKANGAIQKLSEKIKTHKEKIKSKSEVIKNMNDAIEHEKALKNELEKQRGDMQRSLIKFREEKEEDTIKIGELKEKLGSCNEQLKSNKETINWLNQQLNSKKSTEFNFNSTSQPANLSTTQVSKNFPSSTAKPPTLPQTASTNSLSRAGFQPSLTSIDQLQSTSGVSGVRERSPFRNVPTTANYNPATSASYAGVPQSSASTFNYTPMGAENAKPEGQFVSKYTKGLLGNQAP
jgi:hypothetical protein